MAVDVIYLGPGEQMPERDCWMLIEADGSGRFLATGAGRTPEGRTVFYSERDHDLDAVIEASQLWNVERRITQIHVQRTP